MAEKPYRNKTTAKVYFYKQSKDTDKIDIFINPTTLDPDKPNPLKKTFGHARLALKSIINLSGEFCLIYMSLPGFNSFAFSVIKTSSMEHFITMIQKNWKRNTHTLSTQLKIWTTRSFAQSEGAGRKLPKMAWSSIIFLRWAANLHLPLCFLILLFHSTVCCLWLRLYIPDLSLPGSYLKLLH